MISSSGDLVAEEPLVVIAPADTDEDDPVEILQEVSIHTFQSARLDR